MLGKSIGLRCPHSLTKTQHYIITVFCEAVWGGGSVALPRSKQNIPTSFFIEYIHTNKLHLESEETSSLQKEKKKRGHFFTYLKLNNALFANGNDETFFNTQHLQYIEKIKINDKFTQLKPAVANPVWNINWINHYISNISII